MPFLDKVFTIFSAEQSDSLADKFQESVTSSYFRRFTISWILWNWKLFLILFFVSDVTFAAAYPSFHTKIEWLADHYYKQWYYGLVFVIFGPAATALVVYLVLENLNILSYGVTKWSWHKRAKIEVYFNKNTRATNRMVEHYINVSTRDQAALHQLTNNLHTKEAEYDRLVITVNEHKQTIEKLNEEIISLKTKDKELLKKEEKEKVSIKATEAIEKINRSGQKQAILQEFNFLYKKIKDNGGPFKPNSSSNLREFLVTLDVFNKDDKTNEYSMTAVAEEVNAQLIMQHH